MLKGFLISNLIALGCLSYGQQAKWTLNGLAQGTSYHLTYYADGFSVSKSEIDSILHVIDLSMSLYNSKSTISLFNKADSGITLDSHMLAVIQRSWELNQKSNGVFDITIGPLVGLWGFGPYAAKSIPQKGMVDSVLQFVGMDKLQLDGNILKKHDVRTQVDLNGIAQGYSVDVLCHFLDRKKIDNYLVELGGEIRVKGYRYGDKNNPFSIAIESPETGTYADVVLELTNAAVTTSGSYRQVKKSNGLHIHHHINPKDGYPIQNSVVSVTVIAPTAMDADGYDNVFMALTPTESVDLANSLNDIEVYVIYKDKDQFGEAFSEGFYNYVKNN